MILVEVKKDAEALPLNLQRANNILKAAELHLQLSCIRSMEERPSNHFVCISIWLYVEQHTRWWNEMSSVPASSSKINKRNKANQIK